ncbi:MAG: hypothetical protein HZA11_11065 [Nitrospirae bacterium]|nr:hypothetical protein [Nitrospirota bacterium]
MILHRQTKSAAQIKGEYDAAYTWFGQYVKNIEKTRLKVYRDNLEFISNSISADDNKVQNELDKYFLVNNMFEVTRLVNIFKTLSQTRQTKGNLPIRKIREMAEGSVYSANESDTLGDSKSRNIQFEFELASFFSDLGLHIRNYEDLTVDLGEYQLSYQCKRPSKLDNIGKSIKNAVRQLAKYNSGHPRNYHAIAISLEKALGFTNSYYETKSTDMVLSEIRDRVSKIRANVDLIEDLVSETKCVLIDYCCRVLCWNKITAQFVPIFSSNPVRLDYKTGAIHKNAIWQKLNSVYNMHFR